MKVRKQQLELDIEQQIGSKSGKEYIKAVYCYPAYLIIFSLNNLFNIMRNATLDEAQAGIKIAGRNINNTQMTPPLWQKAKRNSRAS